MLYSIIFLTGAAILALELLASRIMTPYFGVSLYIWTGILSITLVSLALGYWWGGKLARGHGDRALQLARLAHLYLLMPALAALAIVLACLAYPYIFPALARFHLVVGAFVACLILLFLPLVATSAMNPLLVAIALRARNGEVAADAGAGRIFFISTVGSVAGVLVTAFALIPYISNFRSVILVALSLSMLSLVAAVAPPVLIATRGRLTAIALTALFASTGILWGADAYTESMWPVSYGGLNWKMERAYSSLFGTVKILRADLPETGQFVRLYSQDGIAQNTVDSAGRSLSLYTYALEVLSVGYRPRMQSALVLGLGAGIVPMRLAKRGIHVEAVDIDPVSFRVARELFGFDTTRINAVEADARTFVEDCPRRYDVIVLDLFHGDGIPEYVITRDFYKEVKHCLSPDGIAVFNTFSDARHVNAYAHFLATLKTEFPEILVFRPDLGEQHENSFVVAATLPLGLPIATNLAALPLEYKEIVETMLKRPKRSDDLIKGGKVITDARNPAALDIARMQLSYRGEVVKELPAAFLMN